MNTDAMKKAVLPVITTALLAMPVMAQQAAPSPDSQISQRITEYTQKVDKAASEGKLNAKQAASDKKRIAAIQDQLNKTMTKRHGHLTVKDQQRLSTKLDKEEIKERAQENKPKKMHIAHHGNIMKTPKK